MAMVTVVTARASRLITARTPVGLMFFLVSDLDGAAARVRAVLRNSISSSAGSLPRQAEPES